MNGLNGPKRALIFAACDATRNDGYMGHLKLLCRLLRDEDIEPRVIGFGAGTPVINRTSIITRHSGLFALGLAALAFLMTLLFTRYDVVVVTSAGAPFNPIFAIIARIKKRPLLYDCQDPPIEATARIFANSPMAHVLKAYLQWGTRVIDHAATLTFSVSPGLDRLLRQHGVMGNISRFYNLHNAVTCARDTSFSPRALFGWNDAPILIYVGGLQAGIRGLEDQIEAVRLARAAGSDIRFLIVYGSGNDLLVRGAAADLIEANAIQLIHDVPPERVRACIYDADIAVNKTLEYALPSKVFEYVSLGIEILAVNQCDDVTTLFADFVTPYSGDALGLSERMNSVAHDTRLRSDRVARGKAFIAKLYLENQQSVQRFLAACI